MEEDHGDMDDDVVDLITLDQIPSKEEKIEMRRASKPPSEWLKLLCKEWAIENVVLVETADAKFLDYKPFLKGLLTSQLLCRLSVPVNGKFAAGAEDFWEILGVNDAFDRAYIIAQIERFCSLYNIRGIPADEAPFDPLVLDSDAASIAAATAAGLGVLPANSSDLVVIPTYLDSHALSSASTTAAAVVSDIAGSCNYQKQNNIARASCVVKNIEKAFADERRQIYQRDRKRLDLDRQGLKQRDREETAAQRAMERADREASREEKRRNKMEQRLRREMFALQQKEAALKRAAELVTSNRVPIEITRGALAAKVAQKKIEASSPLAPEVEEIPSKKKRSAVVVSTAADLYQIVTHSNNLYAKYNAIAKEHNQKVNWITVSRELGIHVKVREKYSRMHSRAEQRGFDWALNGHWKLKDHPEIFQEPTSAEQKAKIPPPLSARSRTVVVDTSKESIDEGAIVDSSFKRHRSAAVAYSTATYCCIDEHDGDGESTCI